jgi:hypothetical protein
MLEKLMHGDVASTRRSANEQRSATERATPNLGTTRL